MAECNCAATVEGAWAGVHTEGCASLQPMTTGITDVEWLDAKVCELSDENKRLRAALTAIIADIHEHERINNLAPNPGRKECWDSVARAVEVLSAHGQSTHDVSTATEGE